ncbi:unnamed protein product [Amoebophrya sp. A120]|nr:unnamed protein product [Amoebophrya sp. A120]|eukprot:GSA120T00013673001.1
MYCSAKCYEDTRLTVSRAEGRAQCWRYERGVCQACRLDTEKLREALVRKFRPMATLTDLSRTFTAEGLLQGCVDENVDEINKGSVFFADDGGGDDKLDEPAGETGDKSDVDEIQLDEMATKAKPRENETEAERLQRELDEELGLGGKDDLQRNAKNDINSSASGAASSSSSAAIVQHNGGNKRAAGGTNNSKARPKKKPRHFKKKTNRAAKINPHDFYWDLENDDADQYFEKPVPEAWNYNLSTKQWRHYLTEVITGRAHRSGLLNPLWQADHVLGVMFGGGQCKKDNFQTLCISCHAKKTKEEQALRKEQNLAKKKKAEEERREKKREEKLREKEQKLEIGGKRADEGMDSASAAPVLVQHELKNVPTTTTSTTTKRGRGKKGKGPPAKVKKEELAQQLHQPERNQKEQHDSRGHHLQQLQHDDTSVFGRFLMEQQKKEADEARAGTSGFICRADDEDDAAASASVHEYNDNLQHHEPATHQGSSLVRPAQGSYQVKSSSSSSSSSFVVDPAASARPGSPAALERNPNVVVPPTMNKRKRDERPEDGVLHGAENHGQEERKQKREQAAGVQRSSSKQGRDREPPGKIKVDARKNDDGSTFPSQPSNPDSIFDRFRKSTKSNTPPEQERAADVLRQGTNKKLSAAAGAAKASKATTRPSRIEVAEDPEAVPVPSTRRRGAGKKTTSEQAGRPSHGRGLHVKQDEEHEVIDLISSSSDSDNIIVMSDSE